MDRLQGPSLAHFFGTDQLGRDLFSRIVYGTRIAVGVSVVVMSISLGIGILLGIVAAYAPRAIDQVIVSIFDIINSFPRLILALALVAVLGAGLTNVILLVSVVFIPQFGRVARAQTVAIRNSLYLEAEQVLGAQPWRILLHHVLPNIIGPIFVLASMNIPVVITIEAGLSFLGVGIRPPLASWGGLLHDGYTFLDQSPWLAVFSGLALMLATLGFTLLGEALRDAIDPKLRQSR
jgi:peptide/nickel transport system permease protein